MDLILVPQPESHSPVSDSERIILEMDGNLKTHNLASSRLQMGSRESIRDTLDGKGATGWLVVQVIVWLVGVSTLSFALSTVEEIKVEYEGIFDLVEVVTVGIFSVEYIFRVWVADSYFYIFEPIAIVDLLSILPSWIDSVLPGDQFPALQFLRMLRIFKFIAQSQRGGEAVKAFRKSWDDNSSLLLAASLAGGAVWLVTAALQYLTEKDNSDMDWCYPPVGVPATDAINCECDDDGCEGTGCTCEPRFSSIPSAMFFVILNLSGEFPLADKQTGAGRVLASFTAVMSVAIFAYRLDWLAPRLRVPSLRSTVETRRITM